MEKKQTAACGGGGGGEDVLIEILLQLPVKSLLRFKSVCKSWRDLIQSSFFIHLHTNSSSSSNFGSFILHAQAVEQYNSPHYYPLVSDILMLSESESTRTDQSCEYGNWYWDTDGIWHKFPAAAAAAGDWHWDNTNCCWYLVNHEVSKVDDQLVFKFDYLGQLQQSCCELCYSVITPCYTEAIVGSCNGLICLLDSHLKTVSLWNPATRQFRRLPKSITIHDLNISFFAFGFDVKTKDYKVVRINFFPPTTMAQWDRPERRCRVQVYSLSTDSWRILEGINSLPGQPIYGQPGLYLNGHCFFMTNVFSPDWGIYVNGFIISFDFTNEIFTTMQLPDHDHKQHLSLCCLGGEKMALFTTLQKTKPGYEYIYDYDYDGYEDCDIWVLNEQGRNNDSWTKLHSFQIKSTGGIINSTQLRGLSNNGKFALLETLDSGGLCRRMQWYNLVTKEAKMDLLFCQRVSYADVYKPSLVSIIGGNGAAAAAAPVDSVISGAM